MDQAQWKRLDQLMARQQWKPAAAVAEQMIKNSSEDEHPVILPRLVKCLDEASRYQDAFRYALEAPTAFLQRSDDANYWVRAALGAHQFIDARLFAMNCPPDWQRQLMAKIKQAEDVAHQTAVASLKNQLKTFYHLGDQTSPAQSRLLAQAHQLPLTDFMTGAQFLLRDPFTNQLVKTTLIDLMRQLQIAQQVKYQWLDGQEYLVTPKLLTAIDDDPQLNAVKKLLQERVGQTNPINYQQLKSQAQLQGMLLYPRIDEVITEPKAWVAAMMGSRQTSPAIETAQKWQRKISKQLDSLAGELF